MRPSPLCIQSTLGSIWCVMCDDAEYRAYWATLTDRSEQDVYVPVALREETKEEVGNASVE